mgnify:CR=1 FL=1
MQNCEYIDGIVITKNRTHKRMSSEMAYPKVLLLGCALEYVCYFFLYLVSALIFWVKTIFISWIFGYDVFTIVLDSCLNVHSTDLNVLNRD